MTEEQIKQMVDRFLTWKLPKNFTPDAGISYTRPNYAASVDATPIGTNLFDAGQAEEMVRYLTEGVSAQPVTQAFPTTDEVTLDQYVSVLVQDVLSFAEMWRAGHSGDPENWPMSLPREDWFEQYLSYLDAQ